MAKPVPVQRTAVSPVEALVENYIASCRARGLAPSTIDNAYRYALDDIFVPWCAEQGITEPGQLNQRALDRFTSGLLEHGGKRGQLSRHTVHHYVRVLRQFMRWAAKEGGSAAAARPPLWGPHVWPLPQPHERHRRWRSGCPLRSWPPCTRMGTCPHVGVRAPPAGAPIFDGPPLTPHRTGAPFAVACGGELMGCSSYCCSGASSANGVSARSRETGHWRTIAPWPIPIAD